MLKINGGSCYGSNKMGKSNNDVAKGHKCFANRESRGEGGGVQEVGEEISDSRILSKKISPSVLAANGRTPILYSISI